MGLMGWTLAVKGQPEKGIDQMLQGLAKVQSTGVGARYAMVVLRLAEAYGITGQVDEGLRLLDLALTQAGQTGERQWEAELYRLKGELLLKQVAPDKPQIEACFEQALFVAREQEAMSLELRAATSSARLLLSQGKHQDVNALLAPIYKGFTEGFETADLQEARALLEDGPNKRG